MNSAHAFIRNCHSKSTASLQIEVLITHSRCTVLEFLACRHRIWGCMLDERILNLRWNGDCRLGLIEDRVHSSCL